MSEPNLRALIEQAERDIEIHGHVRVPGLQERLNEVLVAAGLESTRQDPITEIQIHSDEVSLRRVWQAGSCEYHERHDFPEFIVDAPDPVVAATRWRLEGERAGTARAIEDARRNVFALEAAIPRHEARLAEIDALLASD